VRPESRAERIVSLVPSLTEALFGLGLGARVVGVTDWCVHPAAEVAHLPKVGGTKNPSLARVLELSPDLVIANQEENRERDVERLRAAGIPVWVTYPRTVADGVALMRELAQLGAPAERAEPLIRALETAVERARAAEPARRTRVFCPIWKRPWMAVGADTYADDLLALCGGDNVFRDHRERRYPIVSDAEIAAARPEVILLPDEPYAFGARDVAELAEIGTPAAATGRIHCIDGTLISWYGPRIARAIAEVAALLAEPAPGKEAGS
jgi:ABC-type Fe3+-hydroxamate transport system substrate-binding protein